MRHLTTKDFLQWIDHGPVTEVAAQWQTVGTGTMFFHKGKYYYWFNGFCRTGSMETFLKESVRIANENFPAA